MNNRRTTLSQEQNNSTLVLSGQIGFKKCFSLELKEKNGGCVFK
jgi:hypothetical protein